MKKLIKRKTEGNVVYIEKKQKDTDTMDLKCIMCGVVKNEMQLTVENGLYKCECGSCSFVPQIDIEERL